MSHGQWWISLPSLPWCSHWSLLLQPPSYRLFPSHQKGTNYFPFFLSFLGKSSANKQFDSFTLSLILSFYLFLSFFTTFFVWKPRKKSLTITMIDNSCTNHHSFESQYGITWMMKTIQMTQHYIFRRWQKMEKNEKKWKNEKNGTRPRVTSSSTLTVLTVTSINSTSGSRTGTSTGSFQGSSSHSVVHTTHHG